MSRIRCAVPFCRRTSKGTPTTDGDYDPDQEMICREHGRRASKKAKKVWQHLYKKADRLQQKDPDNCTEIECRYILRMIAMEKKAWARFKTSAIEAALGHDQTMTIKPEDIPDEAVKANNTFLISIVADIRARTGVGVKPMLSDLAEAIGDRFDALTADRDRMREAASGVVKAWEVLSEGRYSPRDVERWLHEDMKPAIDRARSALAHEDEK